MRSVSWGLPQINKHIVYDVLLNYNNPGTCEVELVWISRIDGIFYTRHIDISLHYIRDRPIYRVTNIFPDI